MFIYIFTYFSFFFFFEAESHIVQVSLKRTYVSEDDLGLLILLSPPKC